MPLSAASDGEKKYSPPLGTTNLLMLSMGKPVPEWSGSTPVMLTWLRDECWPRTGSKPAPFLMKFELLAHVSEKERPVSDHLIHMSEQNRVTLLCMNANPLLSSLW